MNKYYLEKLNQQQIESLTKRPAIDFENISGIVKTVITDVKKGGDEAVNSYSERFDGVRLGKFLVSNVEIDEAEARIPKDVKTAFRIAANNIEKFHSVARGRESGFTETTKGVTCFTKTVGIEKVGLYIPGGTAPLPSTVLMLAIPARLAGCKEIILCTPPQKDGKVSDIILYAAKLAGVTKIFKIGGAQAIAAMAYGTESVPKVYKILGPGNQYVTAAKMLVSIDPDGAAMDLPAGPSEVLVIADERANAEFVAADLLSQAEHGPDSQVVLVCTDDNKSEEISGELVKQLKKLSRKDITAKALEKSFCLIVDGKSAEEKIRKAIEFSNKYAPEHLIINIQNPDSFAGKVVNAGSVFLGPFSCESAGDYASGTNHTLPTYGYARMYSGVSIDSFVRKITFQTLTAEGIRNLGETVETMADAEGLQAHKSAMTVRMKYLTNKNND
ncbi:MAG: histidinol dehydrogenase [Candidatus Gracilibacteria bacterium]|jgi:histidinol dehydrogenase